MYYDRWRQGKCMSIINYCTQMSQSPMQSNQVQDILEMLLSDLLHLLNNIALSKSVSSDSAWICFTGEDHVYLS